MRWVVINNINGWIILDKQTGITSRQAVTKISKIQNYSKECNLYLKEKLEY